jgi:hypothetical protein
MLATADLADLLGRDTKKPAQRLNPLIEQLAAMDPTRRSWNVRPVWAMPISA